MGRELRLQSTNAWYHVMNRGADHRNIYNDVIHKIIFLDLVADMHKKYAIELHAYCLMNNHYHLLLYTPAANLAQGLQFLSCNYTKKYNKTINADGPIFRGRYKSIHVTSDAYVLQVCRYIHLNPVKAGLQDGINYHWSSYNYYIENNINKPTWLYTSTILDHFNSQNNFQKFAFFHNDHDTQNLENFYAKVEHKNSAVLGGNLTAAISLARLAELVVTYWDANTCEFSKTVFRVDMQKLIFCYIANKVYKYKFCEIAQFLGLVNGNAVAGFMSRNYKKIPEIQIKTLMEVADNPKQVLDILKAVIFGV